MGDQATAREHGWRPVLLLSALSLLIFGGLTALTLIAPEVSRLQRMGATSTILFAASGIACVVVLVWLLRPGSPWLVRHARLDAQLRELVGQSAVIFAGTIASSSRRVVERATGMKFSLLTICAVAVGPQGVALGRPGSTPRTVLLTERGSEVLFALGGPGGGPLRPKSEQHPQLDIHINTVDGEQTVSVDFLVSEHRGRAVRDEAEVKQLIQQLTSALRG